MPNYYRTSSRDFFVTENELAIVDQAAHFHHMLIQCQFLWRRFGSVLKQLIVHLEISSTLLVEEDDYKMFPGKKNQKFQF